MKKLNFRLFILAVIFAALGFTSCKSKTKENTTPVTTTPVDNTANPPAAPVVISGDDELRKGVVDAVKDYPSVRADVEDSVINLSGELTRSDWQKLAPTLNTLRPKRVNSTNLVIK